MTFLSKLFHSIHVHRLNPGKELSALGHKQHRLRVRDKTDAMRRDMGLPPVKWGRL
jgi:hypothetical protein